MSDTTEPQGTPSFSFSKVLHAYADSPFSGILPWIVMSLFSGPGTFEASVCIALALSVFTLAITHRKGSKFKMMELFDVLFFVGFAIVGLVASAGVITWLELWAGEIVNIALVLFALFTIVIKRPFTMEYAKETTDPSVWKSPLFIHINYAITWVWAGAFAISAAVGIFGDLVLKNSNNFWTGWILQTAPMIFAIAFTEFYPDSAKAKFMNQPAPSLSPLVDWIPVFILITGIAGLVTDSVTTVVGVVLIVAGGIGLGAVNRSQKKDEQPESVNPTT